MLSFHYILTKPGWLFFFFDIIIIIVIIIIINIIDYFSFFFDILSRDIIWTDLQHQVEKDMAAHGVNYV